ASASATPTPRAPAAAAAHSRCKTLTPGQAGPRARAGLTGRRRSPILARRALSSGARAPRLHRGGRGFKSLSAHFVLWQGVAASRKQHSRGGRGSYPAAPTVFPAILDLNSR